jgi:hypothetical protein
MAFYDMFRRWMERPRDRQPRTRLAERRGVRLAVERLEDRTVPSILSAAGVSYLGWMRTTSTTAWADASAGRQQAPLQLHKGGHKSYGGGPALVNIGAEGDLGPSNKGGRTVGSGGGYGGLP